MTRTTRMLKTLVLALATTGLLTAPASAEPASSQVRSFQAGLLDATNTHTCAVTTTRNLRCWGFGNGGQLGYGNIDIIGDNETPNSAGNVPLGAQVVSVAAGESHTCAVLTTGDVRCWGFGGSGQLGRGSKDTIGDDEPASAAGIVPLGAKAVALTAGLFHTCALLTTGDVRCWGASNHGQLGYGNFDIVGDDEPASAAGTVPLGGKAIAITAGDIHTCAVLTTGKIRCWGEGSYGRLGYGNETDIGDNEPASAAGDVPLGASATAITAGDSHTCALLTTGAVRCWGFGTLGRLGYGNTTTVGDDEPTSAAGDVPLGDQAIAVAAGNDHTCAALTTGNVRCWGFHGNGKLGYGNAITIGDDEPVSAAGDVPLGASVTAITAGFAHTCALTTTDSVRCWGNAGSGQLGRGNTTQIGDNEPASAGGDVFLGAKVHGTVADLSVTVAAPAMATTGIPFATTVTVRNSGPDPVSGVLLSVPALAGTPSAGDHDAGTGTWTVGALASGQSATLTLTDPAGAAGIRTSTAEVQTSNLQDPDSSPGDGVGDDRGSATTSVVDPPAPPPEVVPPAVTPPVVVERPKPVATPQRVRGRLSVTATLRPRSRKARISGKLVLPVGTSRTFCSGSVKVSLLRGTRAIATGTAKLKRPARGRTCTFATTATLKKKARLVRRQKLKVSARVVQTTRLARVTTRVTKTVPRR